MSAHMENFNAVLKAIQDNNPTDALGHLENLPSDDVNYQDANQDTLLSHALMYMNVESPQLIEALIMKGACLTIIDSSRDQILLRMLPYPHLIEKLFSMPLSKTNLGMAPDAGDKTLSEKSRKVFLSEILLPFKNKYFFIRDIERNAGLDVSSIPSLIELMVRFILENSEHPAISVGLKKLSVDCLGRLRLHEKFLFGAQKYNAITKQQGDVVAQLEHNQSLIDALRDLCHAPISIGSCRKLSAVLGLVSLGILAAFGYLLSDPLSSPQLAIESGLIGGGLLLCTGACYTVRETTHQQTIKLRDIEKATHAALSTPVTESLEANDGADGFVPVLTVDPSAAFQASQSSSQTASRFRFLAPPPAPPPLFIPTLEMLDKPALPFPADPEKLAEQGRKRTI